MGNDGTPNDAIWRDANGTVTGTAQTITSGDVHTSGTSTSVPSPWVISTGGSALGFPIMQEAWRSASGSDLPAASIDAAEIGEMVRRRVEELQQQIADGTYEFPKPIENGYSWMQPGLCASENVFDTADEAIEDAEKWAMNSQPVIVYREGQSDANILVYDESTTFDWNVNMRLVFQPDPRTRSQFAKTFAMAACPNCKNLDVLRPMEAADEAQCRLCGKRVSAEVLTKR